MQQVTRYIVRELGTGQIGILSTEDALLINNDTLTSLPFYPDRDRVDIDFYDLNDNFVETVRDIRTYKIHGILQKNRANQIDVYPVEDCLAYGYTGDVKLTYSFYRNLFSPTNTVDTKLFISEISTDRTEIRTRCLTLSDSELKTVADSIYSKLNLQNYFSEIYLEFVGEGVRAVGTNIMTEVLDGQMYVTFKLYEPLPDTVLEKSQFSVVEKVGDPVRFEVLREVELVEDPVKFLGKPNFNIDVEEQVTNTTGYLNYDQLFSYPVSSSYHELYNLAERESVSVAVNYEDFSEFIHFSSASERLQNFRYKMGLIESYETALKLLPERTVDVQRYESLKKGVISNFDHYERYLYFESGSKAWPKRNASRPYENIPESELDPEWWDSILAEAEAYDENNQDILTETIPVVLREDSRNEPYVVFVHMIGQHFDNEWIYAKALADKYKADNRLSFGISKDLVREAIRDLGINLYESNQNLNRVFELCNPDGTYDSGSETSVGDFKRISDPQYSGNTEYQPMLQDTYRKEIYKRIYHNLPLLLKSKGTHRGLRALINCFGIPEDILRLEVRGGVRVDSEDGYFGPMDEVSSSYAKVRLDCSGSVLTGEGSPVLSRFVSVVKKNSPYSDDSHQVTLGFDLNGQVNRFFRSELSDSGFDYDDLVGNLRNHEENYKGAFSKVRNQLLATHKGSFRSPATIIRLVRYFDSMLFRSVEEFLPARDSVSVGAIVEDNILHRNRYRGATPTGSGHVGYTVDSGMVRTKQTQVQDQNLLISGNLDIVTVSGSDAGPLAEHVQSVPDKVYSVGGRTIVRSGSVPTYESTWSTGKCTGSKPVFDDSPAYTGEYGGSQLEASDAEVWNNPYRRGGASATMYRLSAMMLDKPSPLFCDVVLNLKNDSHIHEYWTMTASVNDMHPDPVRHYSPFEFRVPSSGATILAESRSISLDKALEIGTAETCFIGWTSGSTSADLKYHSFGRELKGSRSVALREEFVPFGSDKCQTIKYATADRRERIRIQVANISDYIPEHNYYGNQDIVISYLMQSRSGSRIYADTVVDFDVKVRYTNGKTDTFTVRPGQEPECSTYGECWGITVRKGNLEHYDIDKYGVTAIRLALTSYPEVHEPTLYPGGIFVDADWYDLDPEKQPGWIEDNQQAATHGWKIYWTGRTFDWIWL